MFVCEIYKSIQGESTYSGIPMVFVRLSYCNLRCEWCDTTYTFYEGTEMSIDEIIEKVNAYGLHFVEITGGEPLVQKETPELIRRLLDMGYTVLVETSGILNIGVIPQKAVCIMDIKCPSSNESEKNDWDNIKRLRPHDQVKFVIGDREDYEWAKSIIASYKLTEITTVLFSTVFERLPAAKVVEWILQDKLSVRFQPQLHKYIWGPGTRGV